MAVADNAAPPRGLSTKDFLIAAAVGLVVAVAGWFFFVRDTSEGVEPPVLVIAIDEPESGAVLATTWDEPSAVALEGELVHVLDTGKNRILTANREGVVSAIVCETDACAFTLDAPEDLAVYGNNFYVANTELGTVEVIDKSGNVLRTLAIPASEAGPPRATGVHVAPDGTVYASDRTSGRVAIFSRDGEFLRFFGEDTVPGIITFSEPAGLTLDAIGNIYVAEFDNGQILKYSPDGRELATFVMIPGATGISASTDVVVGDDGTVYMADTRRSMVHVFSSAARYLGIIGLADGSRRDSPSVLRAPYGLAIDGDELAIIDRGNGMLVFQVDPEYFVVGSVDG